MVAKGRLLAFCDGQLLGEYNEFTFNKDILDSFPDNVYMHLSPTSSGINWFLKEKRKIHTEDVPAEIRLLQLLLS